MKPLLLVLNLLSMACAFLTTTPGQSFDVVLPLSQSLNNERMMLSYQISYVESRECMRQPQMCDNQMKDLYFFGNLTIFKISVKQWKDKEDFL